MATTVNVGGIEWTIWSRNERSCLHNGNHYFASRCGKHKTWKVAQLSGPLGESPREIGHWGHIPVETANLSAFVKGLS